jgi:hypothetical protein
MPQENDYLLTFELSKEKNELFIHMDENGIDFLIDELTRLAERVKRGETDHTHLMTEEWGGGELSSESQGDEVLNHVKIYCWKTNK